MYANRKKPNYKLFLTIGWIVSAAIAIADIRLGIGFALLVPTGAFAVYAINDQ